MSFTELPEVTHKALMPKVKPALKRGCVSVNEEQETVFEILKHKVHSTSNSNFHFDRLDWKTQIWILELCHVIDDLMGGGGRE